MADKRRFQKRRAGNIHLELYVLGEYLGAPDLCAAALRTYRRLRLKRLEWRFVREVEFLWPRTASKGDLMRQVLLDKAVRWRSVLIRKGYGPELAVIEQFGDVPTVRD